MPEPDNGMFATLPMLPALSGQAGTAESLFGKLLPDVGPNAEQMELERQRVLYNKAVKFNGYGVKTYDLGDTRQRGAYKKQMEALFAGMQAHSHVILVHERRFVEQPKPRWVAHVEWMQFELTVKSNPTTAGKQEIQDEQAGT
jgi:hypothetical protein